VLPFCDRCAIIAPAIPDQTYSVGNPLMVIALPNWAMNMTSCGPLTFTATLPSNKALPSFIKLKTTPLSLQVVTPFPTDANTYSITVKADAPSYSKTDSTLSVTFNLKVVCVPL